MFTLPEKGVLSAVIWTVHNWCLDFTAGPEESSTSDIQRLQKFCRHNCWVFATPRKSEHQLSAESAECCQTRRSNHLPSREAPAQTATGEPDMPQCSTEVYLRQPLHRSSHCLTSTRDQLRPVLAQAGMRPPRTGLSLLVVTLNFLCSHYSPASSSSCSTLRGPFWYDPSFTLTYKVFHCQ